MELIPTHVSPCYLCCVRSDHKEIRNDVPTRRLPLGLTTLFKANCGLRRAPEKVDRKDIGSDVGNGEVRRPPGSPSPLLEAACLVELASPGAPCTINFALSTNMSM
ncbi:hypothetical protein Bbelb_139570 [Branchiostoma belcheri]|nr:hypothetical protein Bbelb_139570 [Branchiostoma belcheri]